MKKTTLVGSTLIILSSLIGSCNQTEEKESIVSKEPIHDKIESYSVPNLGHGKMQSPINILSNQTEDGKHNVTFHFDDEINKVENLGHTVQLDFTPGNTITEGNKTYEFKQVHFHTPSEHLVDGMTYPMEMHMVNQLVDQKEGETTEYLVVAFLFKMGEPNKFIEEFINLVPKEEHQTQDVEIGTIKLTDLLDHSLSEELNSFYHYKGSLTTPPYTETVDWHISKTIFEASPEQIQAINKIEGNNARHVQALYGRHIEND